MFGLGPQELLILAVLGLLFFGSNLPKLGRSLGRTIVEFRKGVAGIEEDIASGAAEPTATPMPARPPERLVPPAPKFDVAESTGEERQQAEEGPPV